MSDSSTTASRLATPATGQPPRLTLEIFSDLRCPFCYLEVPEIEALKEHFADEVAIHWRAFELRPEPEPALDPAGDYLNRLWQEAVLPMATERGLTMRQPTRQPRSRRALEAVAWAQRHHGQAAADTLRLALFKGFFEDSLDLGDAESLGTVADEQGLDGHALRMALAIDADSESVAADRHLGQTLGIGGVPALRFLVDGEHAGILSGAQPRRQLLLAVERLRDALTQRDRQSQAPAAGASASQPKD